MTVGGRWRRAGAWGLVGLTVASAGCRETTPPLAGRPPTVPAASPAEVLLAPGRAVLVDGVLTVRFASVPADSRCPSLALCVWEGDGAVAVTYAFGPGPTVPDTLHTTLGPTFRSFEGYAITLLELLPYPATSDPIPQNAYTIRVRIAPLELVPFAR